MESNPGGFGPWFCTLLFNTSKSCKTQTHLISHSHPHLALDRLNQKNARMEHPTDCWVMMVKIGPFNVWEESLSFLHLWMAKTRGKSRRLERGFELFHAYKSQYGLNMWIQDKPQELALRDFVDALPSFPNREGRRRLRKTLLAQYHIVEDAEVEKEVAEQQKKLHKKFFMSMSQMREIFAEKDVVCVKRVRDLHEQIDVSLAGKRKKKKV